MDRRAQWLTTGSSTRLATIPSRWTRALNPARQETARLPNTAERDDSTCYVIFTTDQMVCIVMHMVFRLDRYA
jgi:hypothetical protein